MFNKPLKDYSRILFYFIFFSTFAFLHDKLCVTLDGYGMGLAVAEALMAGVVFVDLIVVMTKAVTHQFLKKHQPQRGVVCVCVSKSTVN